jgi:hypothetical protein
MARKQVPENPLVVSTGAAVPARRKSPTAKKRVSHAANVSEGPASEIQVEETVAIAVSAPGPSYDEIAKLAYSFWEARGYQGGSPEEDWLRAEQQLTLSAK